MNLKRKTLLILCLTIIGLVAVLYGSSRLILLGRFEHLQSQRVTMSIQSALDYLGDRLTQLDEITECWADRDDAGAFLREYARTDFQEFSGASVSGVAVVDWVLLADPNGRVLVDRRFGPDAGRDSSAPGSVGSMISRGGLLVSHPGVDSRHSGLLVLPEGPQLVISRPLRSSGSRIAGILIAGLELDEVEIARMSERARLPVTLHSAADHPLIFDFEDTARMLSQAVPVVSRDLSDRFVVGETYLNDVYSQYCLMLRVTVPRDIVAQGRLSFTQLACLLIAVAVVFGVVVMKLLDTQVLDRLAHLSGRVAAVGRSGDLSRRVAVDGEDELSQLGVTINGMLERLQQAEEEVRVRERQLIQADKMATLGILVSGVAHELNNPTQFIASHLAPLKNMWQDALPILDRYSRENGEFLLGGREYSVRREQIQRIFSGIDEGIFRIRTIMEGLRDYAQEQPAGMLAEVQFNDVVGSARELLGNLLKKSTNHFTLDLAESLPRVKGNYQRLEQVVVNLIQNACQALENTEKAITVSTSYDESAQMVVLTVSDEGPGIPQEDFEHVTDPFFTTKRDSGGTGLGLSISANIVSEHGGTLEFSSVQGKGTVACVRLPKG